MRKGLFWLNDKQWARIEPHLPRTRPDRLAMTIAVSSAVSFTCFNAALDGATVRLTTVLTRRFTTGSIAGPNGGIGKRSLKRLPAAARTA
jgi:transposase